MRRYLTAVLFGLAVTSTSVAQNNVLKIEVAPSKTSLVREPICIPLSVPKEWAKFDEVLVLASRNEGGATQKLIGQLTAPGIITESIRPAKEGLVRRDLHVLNVAGSQWFLTVHFEPVKPEVIRFGWLESEQKNHHSDLVVTYSGKFVPVLRYMHQPYDSSSKDAREKTYKVFHHLYDPPGKRLVTNGGFTNQDLTDPKTLLYPHHRGIQYGFMKCSYGEGLKMHADTWHCPPPSTDPKKVAPTAHVSHMKTLITEAGPLVGRHRVLLGWYGAGEKPFATEERELTVYRGVEGGTLVEFASRLKTTGGPVKIDGDPQHAGFQFRAANEVAEKKSAAQTYYLRPDGKGKFGETRNWDPKTKKGPVDLPWDVLSFVLDGQRYSVEYMNHPSNPKESRFSERDYGRFGCYFEYDLTEQTPLVVNYRLWLQNGEMTQTQAEALQTAFAAPPTATVK